LSKIKKSQTKKGEKAVQVLKAISKPKAKPASKPKPLPRPVWTRVVTDLRAEDAEARIHIREFALRFASVLQLTHSNLDELEEISGDNLGPVGGWDVEDDQDLELVSWVSDLCVKSLIQGLLEAIVSGLEGDDGKAFQEAIKALKGSSANLNRVWSALVSLRDALGSIGMSVSNPLPPPASVNVRTTRSGVQSKDTQNIYISHSAQLVPVIVDLIEAAIESPAIRNALEAGSIEEKELGKEVRDAISNENARWKSLSQTKDKARRAQHSKLLQDLEFSHRVAASRYAPRFAPLGQDLDGRVYYAISPAVGEIEAAGQLIRGKHTRPKIGRKRLFGDEDREELQRWSWFIAVWGRKPEGAEEAMKDEDEDEDEQLDEDEKAWWGFWQPEEIKKLSAWLAIKSGLTTELYESDGVQNGALKGKRTNGRGIGSAVSSGLTSLATSRDASPLSELSNVEEDEDLQMMKIDSEGRPVPIKRDLRLLSQGLREYAELLEWRIQRVSGDI
jgi:hypothetical protein